MLVYFSGFNAAYVVPNGSEICENLWFLTVWFEPEPSSFLCKYFKLSMFPCVEGFKVLLSLPSVVGEETSYIDAKSRFLYGKIPNS